MRKLRQKINLILTLAVMLTMAQTAWAANEETVTWTMDGGKSGQTTLSGDYTLTNTDGKEINYSTTGSGIISNNVNLQTTNFRQLNGGFIEFTNLKGVVTKVEMSHFSFKQGGMQMYVGLDKDDTSALLHIQGSNNDYDFPSSDDSNNQSVTFEGSVTASQNAHLKIMFSGSSSSESLSFKQGSIVVTYIPEDKVDHGHNFTSIVANGNVLTATCTNNETGHVSTCGLQNRQATLTLIAEDVPYDMQKHNAELQPSLGTFQDETGLTLTSSGISYTNKGNNNVSPNGPYEIGSYTANVTITIGGTGYTLTKDFDILAGFKVNNNYSQFSVNKISALEGDEVTITYTKLMDEILEGLTLTGATSGNNIAYTQSGNIYTLNMPDEDVNINATITYPLNEDNITQSGNTYTIKTADGWNYFCQRMDVDAELNGFNGKTVMLSNDIIVTKMAGNGRYPFKGTFDGDGHTLTFNYTADMANCAPFCITDGATIRNLHATGSIEGGDWHYISGLVGSASGNLTIENCRVSTQISSTVSGIANNGGFVGYLSSGYKQCYITGCVFDGLIYNPDYSGTTYGCCGFVGAMSLYGYAILEDCLFIHGQYDNNNGKCELWWGNENNKNSTFVGYDMSNGGAKFTNCFYVGTRGLKQGSPAVESATAPTNFAHFGTPIDHRFLKVYGHTMVFGGKYYTPIYGDLVEEYAYNGVKDYNIEYDDAPLGIPDITSPLRTECLTYNRSFTAGKPVTIMLPFNFTRNRITLAHDNANPSGKFYEFKGIDNLGNPIMDDGNEVMENTLQANHPYLYVPGESTEYWDTYVSGGINIFTQDNGGGSKVAAYEGFELRGTYTEKVWEENDPEIGKAYVYNANGELVPVTAGTKIRPTECYIIQTKKLMTGTDITVNVTGSGSVSIGNQTATEGNPFTTSVDDGASVTLTFAPDAGNIVTDAKLSYKYNETDIAVDDIAISGSTATFQMPNDIWNGTGVTINVTFGDALIGGADEASAVALTDATVSYLAGGYYKVESDISFDHTLNLIGDTYLVIASGAKMTVSSSEFGINSEWYALNVLGEGTLNVTTTGSYKIAVYVSSYTQSGCSVNLTTTHIGMRCSGSFNISGGSFTTNGTEGIWPNNSVNISGGKLEASKIDANINLSYSSTDDYIKVDTYTNDKTMTIANGQTFTDGATNYSGTIENLSALNGKKLFPFAYTHLTVRDATCTEVGIKQECWQRSSDGKYFSDANGTNELNASDVETPMIPHTGVRNDATDTHIEYWQCSVCSKYFSNSGCTTEITEEDTKIYRTITIADGISSLVTSNVDKAVAGTTVTLTVSYLIDASTLRVNDGSVALTDAGNGTYTFTVPAADVTVTASTATTYSVNLPANMEIVSATTTADGDGKYISGTVVTFKASFSYTASNVSDGANTLTADGSGNYSVTVGTADITVMATIGHSSNIDLSQAPGDFTVVDGDILTAATSHTVTIAENAKITLSNATISGGIVCDGTAEITLVGTNSVTGASFKAGIQVGGSGTTLTIKGNGSLNANGGDQSAGIGLSRAWDMDATGGNIVIEGGTVTATGDSYGAGIGTGVCWGDSSDKTATLGSITIKGGTVTAIGGNNNGNGIGKGYAYGKGHTVVGTVTIYDGINRVEASSISESIVYKHGNIELTTDEQRANYFTITEDGNRRVITSDLPTHFSQSGNEYTIHTATGWSIFCDCLDDNDTYNRFSGKTVKLGANIGTAQDPITRMAGSSKHDFCGTFDGQGYTLYVNISSDSRDYTAPFSYVANAKANPGDAEDSPAAIRNLKVAGTVNATKDYAGGIVGAFWGTLTIENCASSVAINTNNKHAAGFISRAQGSATIRNCLSSVAITGTISGDGTHAGFIGGSSNGVTTTIEGCAFTGSMLGSTTTHCAGFVGYNSGTLTISNSLFAPTEVTVGATSSATFARGNEPTTTNTYYTEALGTAQGKQARNITAGEHVTVANAGNATEYTVSGITSYGAGIKYGSNLYAGSGDEVSLTLSHGDREGYTFDGGYAASAGTLSGTDNPYTLTMPDENVTISAAWLRLPYVTVKVTGSGTVTCGEQNATDGNPFDVTTEKGASVVLTLAPTDGNAVRSVAYGYTNNSGTTASGLKLPISGTTATLTVPDDLKGGTGVTVTVTFVPALNGGADEASAVALTDATVTDLGGGWYKVENGISFDHTLNLLADTYLTIAEGKTMTVNTASGEAIDSEYTLNVSGEGALSVTTTEAYKIAVRVGSYVQTGATVTASGYIGIRCTDNFDEFNVTNDFTFSGGQLTATGSGGDGIDADNDITLSCSNATDFIQASSYRSTFGAVKIAEGKALTDGTEASDGMNGYSGTLTTEQRTAIGGKTLHRAVTTSYVDASGTLHENVIAIPLDNTMTTLPAGTYVVNENVDYTGQITLGGDVNIILCDGKTMTVTNTGTDYDDLAIYGESKALHIYGQSQGTGALTATAVGGGGAIILKNDNGAGSLLGIHGGMVTASTSSDNGICVQCVTDADGIVIDGGQVTASGDGLGIICVGGHFDILGGQVTATGTNDGGLGICDRGTSSGVLTLGCSKATDFISANKIYNYSDQEIAGEVKIADGQTLVDDGGNIWSGTLSNDDLQNSLLNKTLRPVMGVVLTKDGSGNISAEFDGTSLETVSIPVNITVNSVTLNRTFTNNKCATLMLPFSLSTGQSLNGGTLYKFDGVNNGEGDWVATLSEFTSPLKANTPYLIEPNGHMTDDKITFDLKGGTVTLNTTTAGEDSNEKDDLWDFIGTYSYIKWTTDTSDPDYSAEREAEIGKVYGFAAVEKTGIHVGDFVRVASGAKIRPMCAYLKWKGSVLNNAPALNRAAANDEELPSRITVRLVGANGEVTNIGTLDTITGEVSFDGWFSDQRSECGAAFDMSGRRLNGKPTTKGLYINNGRKVVIK